eukprot:Gregarina_sp_Pseudo_9__3012@NODE_321_length_3162_cov_8_196606_g301_i0_p1_GENE_NODE_321_length_3162_cov_8_196606_g301_i0NODE_321_length_3162_cov_8_196606_g301_i0_p1_ORF_typecomplete_len1034_score188_41CLASP_N/PF12348_8/1_8e03CLASP_N/PF12348_8/2_8e03CLASP_N/PF12348_8/1_3e14_NODE_321_length_3162_cov_8_196606_g301_i0612844
MNEVSVKIAIESFLRLLFSSLILCAHKGFDVLALQCVKEVANPFFRCQFLLILLQESKSPFCSSVENQRIAREIISSVSKDTKSLKLAELASAMLNKRSAVDTDSVKTGSVGPFLSALHRSRSKNSNTSGVSGPRIAIHDCRLETSKVRNQKHNKVQLEIVVVLDLQCANCDTIRNDISCIAHQTGLFVKEAVLRSKDMKMPVLEEFSPHRKRFEAEASMSRKRPRQENSTDGECDDGENYAPSPEHKLNLLLNSALPPQLSSGDGGAEMRCELAGIRSQRRQRLSPPPTGLFPPDGDTGKTYKFEATNSWLSQEEEDRPETELPSPSPSLDGPNTDPSPPSSLLPTTQERAVDAVGVSAVSTVSGDAIQSGALTEVSSVPFVSPSFPVPSESPTASVSDRLRSLSQKSSSVGGNDADDLASADSRKSNTSEHRFSSMTRVLASRSFQCSQENDDEEDEELISPNSRTLLHPFAPESLVPTDRQSEPAEETADARLKAPPRYSQTFCSRQPSPSHGLCSQSTSQCSTPKACVAPTRNTLTSPSRVSVSNDRRSPNAFSRRSFLTPGPGRPPQRGPSPPTSPVSMSPISAFRRQSTMSHKSREPLRQRSRTSAASPMSSSLLSSSPSLKTPRDAELLTPFSVVSPHLLNLIVTCLGDCTNLGTSRKSSAVMLASKNLDASAPPLSADVLREELELHDPSDPLVTGLAQAKSRGGVWLVHHHVLQGLRRMSFFHADVLEQFDQLSSLYVLMAKSTECLRSSIAKKALAVIKDFYTPVNSLRKRLLDTGVNHVLPACLRRASDQSNLFLADAAINAYEAVVQNASEVVCMSTLKPVTATAISSGQRWHLFRAATLVVSRLQAKLTSIVDVDKIITFAVKGLRDASSESRSEARNLCNAISKCLDQAPPAAVSRLRMKVKVEDWVKLTERK